MAERKYRSFCPLCEQQYPDMSIMTRLNHKCPIPEVVDYVAPLPPKDEGGSREKVKTPCRWCGKSFIKIEKHLLNCKKKI